MVHFKLNMKLSIIFWRLFNSNITFVFTKFQSKGFIERTYQISGIARTRAWVEATSWEDEATEARDQLRTTISTGWSSESPLLVQEVWIKDAEHNEEI